MDDAKKKIAALQVAKDRHIDKVKQVAAERQAKAASLEDRHTSMKEMNQDFKSVALKSATLQERGYTFEKFLAKMARFYGLKVTSSFRVRGTQIDGTVKYDGENYNIEAKWHDRSLSDEPIMAFCHKQEMNMHGRGIFISINGYTGGTLSLLERSSIKNTVLMDGEDITLILSELITLPDLLDVKIRAAQTQGKFYINPITKQSKIP